jgi:hypothetical protein
MERYDQQNHLHPISNLANHLLVNHWSNHMHTLIQLLKSRTIVFAILLAILPLFAQYIGVFNLTPIPQMIALQVIAAVA